MQLEVMSGSPCFPCSLCWHQSGCRESGSRLLPCHVVLPGGTQVQAPHPASASPTRGWGKKACFFPWCLAEVGWIFSKALPSCWTTHFLLVFWLKRADFGDFFGCVFWYFQVKSFSSNQPRMCGRGEKSIGNSSRSAKVPRCLVSKTHFIPPFKVYLHSSSELCPGVKSKKWVFSILFKTRSLTLITLIVMIINKTHSFLWLCSWELKLM